MNIFKFTVVCAAVIATAGCDQGQPANPTPTTTPEQGTSTVPFSDFDATKKAAESGDAEAQLSVGMTYQFGRGVPRDNVKAAKWMRLSAEQGNATAQANLGAMYALGDGLPRDYAEAGKWYRLAAEQGDTASWVFMGEMYKNGYGVTQDLVEAYAWYDASTMAKGGSPFASSKRESIEAKLTADQLAAAKKRTAELLEKYGSGN